MSKVNPGFEIKQVLCGIYRYQWTRLEEVCSVHNLTRSEIIREAIDLWLRGFDMHEAQEENADGGTTADDDSERAS